MLAHEMKRGGDRYGGGGRGDGYYNSSSDGDDYYYSGDSDHGHDGDRFRASSYGGDRGGMGDDADDGAYYSSSDGGGGGSGSDIEFEARSRGRRRRHVDRGRDRHRHDFLGRADPSMLVNPNLAAPDPLAGLPGPMVAGGVLSGVAQMQGPAIPSSVLTQPSGGGGGTPSSGGSDPKLDIQVLTKAHEDVFGTFVNSDFSRIVYNFFNYLYRKASEKVALRVKELLAAESHHHSLDGSGVIRVDQQALTKRLEQEFALRHEIVFFIEELDKAANYNRQQWSKLTKSLMKQLQVNDFPLLKFVEKFIKHKAIVIGTIRSNPETKIDIALPTYDAFIERVITVLALKMKATPTLIRDTGAQDLKTDDPLPDAWVAFIREPIDQVVREFIPVNKIVADEVTPPVPTASAMSASVVQNPLIAPVGAPMGVLPPGMDGHRPTGDRMGPAAYQLSAAVRSDPYAQNNDADADDGDYDDLDDEVEEEEEEEGDVSMPHGGGGGDYRMMSSRRHVDDRMRSLKDRVRVNRSLPDDDEMERGYKSLTIRPDYYDAEERQRERRRRELDDDRGDRDDPDIRREMSSKHLALKKPDRIVERERERERERGREREHDRHRMRAKERERERERDRHGHRHREKDKDEMRLDELKAKEMQYLRELKQFKSKVAGGRHR